VAAVKQSDTTAAAKAEAAKTAKLEVEKKQKRKRKTSPPPVVETPRKTKPLMIHQSLRIGR
jgi:hypothetical protein